MLSMVRSITRNVYLLTQRRIAEPFNDNGTWRNSIFYTTIGSGYVATALKAARAADPTAKLYVSRSLQSLAIYIDEPPSD